MATAVAFRGLLLYCTVLYCMSLGQIRIVEVEVEVEVVELELELYIPRYLARGFASGRWCWWYFVCMYGGVFSGQCADSVADTEPNLGPAPASTKYFPTPTTPTTSQGTVLYCA